MCGLVGFIGSKRQDSVLGSMLKVLSYRGPDDSGALVEGVNSHYIHLGQNRLSIQDTSKKGHQPFVSDCGNYVLVFNGEVYNFKDIRVELENLGQSFISGSDTEVILYAFKHWGIDCLDRFIGMFAFAVLDKHKQQLTLVRDRAGVKPLYYYYRDNELAFASELKSFHQLPSFTKKLNKSVLPYYFQFGYIPAPHSIFENTHKLMPGHYLQYDLKNINGVRVVDSSSNNKAGIKHSDPIDIVPFKIVKYWDVADHYKKKKFVESEKEIIQKLEMLLKDAINLRMVSDVPVGVFLSGGYDSTLVTALLAQNTDKKVHTFTIGFDDKQYNEADYAKDIAKHFDTKHTEYYVSEQDMIGKIKQLPYFFDEPFGAGSALPIMILSEIASKDVKVVLSADGGDEAFCGYSKYFILNKFMSSFNSPFKKSIIRLIVNILPGSLVKFVNNMVPKKYRNNNIYDKYMKFKRAFRSADLQEMFLNGSSSVDGNDIRKILKVDVDKKIYNKFLMDENLSFLENMMLTDYKTFMVDEVLTKVDRSTMSASIEGREPLIDHRIVEFMARVPDSIKYKNKKGKYLIREILNNSLPKSLIDRPKSGFSIPMSDWLRGDLKLLVEKYLSSSKLDDDIFNTEALRQHCELFFNGDDSKANSVWYILQFQMWREKWKV
jgi:asparagine synthase (glutamine-hydrolysing)